jgi:putative oxidoreductase
MRPLLCGFREPLYALMRLIIGFLFACHGAQKLFGVLGGEGHAHGKFLVAGIVEFFGGVLIAVGLCASIVAFIAAGEMAVAYFTVHAHMGTFPIVNHGELAVAYCFVFLYIAARGSGKLSLDSLLFKGAGNDAAKEAAVAGNP